MLKHYELLAIAVVVLAAGWFVFGKSAGEDIQTAAMKGDTAAVLAILKGTPSLAKAVGYRNYTPLHWAALDGNIKMAEVLLADGADPNVAAGKKNVTPLHLAVDGHHLKIVELLLAHKADPDARDSDGDSVLSWAAELNRPKEAALMIAYGAKIRSASKTGMTPLHWAANCGNSQVAEILLAAGANIEAKGKAGSTPIGLAHFGVRCGVAKVLIKHGANVRVSGVLEGVPTTLLHLAANWGNVGVAQLLIDRKLDVNARDPEGDTPLSLALSNVTDAKYYGGDPLAVTALLLDHGANPNTKDRAGISVGTRAADAGSDFILLLNKHLKRRDILSAIYRHDLRTVKSMLKARPSLVHATYYRNDKSLLYIAASAGDLGIVKLIVDAGAKVDENSDSEETPLCAAISFGHQKVVEFLLDRGADPNVDGGMSSHSGGPLSRAAIMGDTDTMKLLLDHGARVSGAGHGELAPLMAGATYGTVGAVNVLLQAGADPNSRELAGRNTALMCAAQDPREGPAKIRALVRRGADVDAIDQSGSTALHMAINCYIPQNAEELIKCGANVNARNVGRGLVWDRLRSIFGRHPAVSQTVERPLALTEDSSIIRMLLLHGASE